MLQLDVDLDPFSQQKIPKFNRLCGTTNEKERKSGGTNSASELTAVEFIGIQMHHNLNRVTIDLGVIAQQAKRSSYKIFSKNWQSKPPTVEFHASLNLFTGHDSLHGARRFEVMYIWITEERTSGKSMILP